MLLCTYSGYIVLKVNDEISTQGNTILTMINYNTAIEQINNFKIKNNSIFIYI